MKKIFYIQITALFLIISLVVLVFFFREEIIGLKEYGYLGVFLISIFSATLAIPSAFLWIAIVSLAVILNPWIIGFLAGLGATLGQTTGYLLGYSGRLTLKNSIKHQRIIYWVQRWGCLAIFLFALIPNPFGEIAGVAAGFLKIPFLKFIFACFLGMVPKYIFVALIASWGFEFFF